MHHLRSAALIVAASLLIPATSAFADDTIGSSPAVETSLGADPAPTGLAVHSTGNRTVNLTWDPVAGASKYAVKVAVAANPDGILNPALGSVTYVAESAKVGNLTNGVTYSFAVAATVNAKLTDYSLPVLAAPTPGEIPSNLRVADIGNGAVYLDFDASDRATGYKINTTVLDANGVPAPLAGAASVNTATSSATVTKLSNGVEYGFQVAAVVDGYNTDWSAPKIPATPLAVPNKAGTPAVGVVTGSSIQVKWAATTITTPAEPVDFYQVSYGPSLDATPILVRSDAISYTAAGLTAGVEYSFKVRAHNPAGYGPWSLPLKVVAADKPGAVTNLSALRFADGHSIDLTWTAPKFAGGGAVTKYVVAISPKVGTQVVEPAPATHATLNGLDPATDYKLSVTAYTAAGAGGANSITSLAQSPQVEAEPVLATDGSVTWTFTGVSNPALDYEAQATQLDRLAAGATSSGKRLTASQLTSRTTVTADTVSCTAGVCTATWKRFGDDIDGEAWLFRVRATDNVSAYSNWATINPAPPVPVEQNFSAQQETGGAWSLLYGSDWAQRTSDRFLKASANGAAFQSSVMSLGKYPGTQTVTVQGLGGTATHTFAMPDGPTFNDAVGGDVSEYTDPATGKHYRVHIFRSSWTFTVNEAPAAFDIFTLGGGGASQVAQINPERSGTGGGGGGGALKSTHLKPGVYAVTVGSAGGTSSFPADNGTISATGGQVGAPGSGSGGDTNFTGGAGGGGRVRSEGNAEGWGGANGFVVDITGTPVTYAGGGGGGGSQVRQPPTSVDGGSGGNGGGGHGAASFSYNPTGGTNGLGAGGGGGGIYWTVTSSPAAAGGSGLVVIRYEVAG